MLLLPGGSLGTRERKRKRNPSSNDLDSFHEDPSATEEKFSYKFYKKFGLRQRGVDRAK